ncbi:MAG TPA: universal stress protein [Anaerolineales bacterium]|nr:universal stress protein [Anaerolineales bacterium]
MEDIGRYTTAVQDFKRARRRADLQEMLAWLGGGKGNRLLSFEEVRKQLGKSSLLPRGLKDIPLDAIVGSVGRYEDFDRQFLPRQESQLGRWARVRMAFDYSGLPPITVYQIGDVYFVLDGHHRVSVANQLGAKHIEAYVTEIPTRVKVKPDLEPLDLILKTEEARFLEETRMDELHPDLDLRVTLPGRYDELRDHISVHRYFMGQAEKREVPYEAAVQHWVNEVYLPALATIRRLDLLRDFPNRTETDIYLWLMKHRADLTRQLGWDLGTEEAAAYLWNRLYTKPRRSWERFRRWLARVIPIRVLRMKPKPTEWRLDRGDIGEWQTLFPRILVPISREDSSWTAVDQAIFVAHKEHAELRGVHVRTAGDTSNNPKVEPIRNEFERRLVKAGLRGGLVLEQGNIPRRVEIRSHWSDLVVLHLKHAPGNQPMQRLLSGLRAFLARSPRPVLVVAAASEMKHALLAYDGSRKANEALYLAAYLAGSWGTKITVFTSLERSLRESLNLQKAKGYLISQKVEADYISRRGVAGRSVVETANEQGCDFVLIGGYGRGGLLEVMLGSTLDFVLREFKGPVWVCS